MRRRRTPSRPKVRRHVRRALNERGSALWEFAFVLTVMLTLIFGVMEFSQVMYAYHFVSNAAREATRYASVRGSTFAAAPFGPYAAPCVPLTSAEPPCEPS